MKVTKKITVEINDPMEIQALIMMAEKAGVLIRERHNTPALCGLTTEEFSRVTALISEIDKL